MELEERKRYPLEKRLKEVIVGQEGAITAVASGNFEIKLKFSLLYDICSRFFT